MLRLSASDMNEIISKEASPKRADLLSGYDVAEIGYMLLAMVDKLIDARFGHAIYSALQFFICYAGAFDEMDFGLRLMLNKGVNLHLERHHSVFGGWSETPTSIALYSSFMFMRWRDALLRSSVDLESFAEAEVQQSPLRNAGWNKDSLLALFRYEFQLDHVARRPVECDDCSQLMLRLCVELSWREWLNRFRKRVSIKYSSNGADSEVKRDPREGDIVEEKFSNLVVEEIFVNEFHEEEDGGSETATSDVHGPDTNMGDFDTYFKGETKYACMPCYLKRQCYASNI